MDSLRRAVSPLRPPCSCRDRAARNAGGSNWTAKRCRSRQDETRCRYPPWPTSWPSSDPRRAQLLRSAILPDVAAQPNLSCSCCDWFAVPETRAQAADGPVAESTENTPKCRNVPGRPRYAEKRDRLAPQLSTDDRDGVSRSALRAGRSTYRD